MADIYGSTGAVAVASAGMTTLGTILVPAGARVMGVSVENSGTKDLDAFTLEQQTCEDGELIEVCTMTEAARVYPVLACGDLTTLAAGTSGFAVIHVRGLYALRFAASSAVAGATTVTLNYGYSL